VSIWAKHTLQVYPQLSKWIISFLNYTYITMNLFTKLHDHLQIHKTTTFHFYIYIRSRQFYALLWLHPFHHALCSELPVSSRSRTAHEKRDITAFWSMELSFIITLETVTFPTLHFYYLLLSFNYTIHPLLAFHYIQRVFIAHFDNIYSRCPLYIYTILNPRQFLCKK
jgi:hypothetical protein